MKKHLYWIIPLIIVILLAIIFRKQIANWWNGGIGNADGAPCKTPGSATYDGHFKKGNCIKDAKPGPAAGNYQWEEAEGKCFNLEDGGHVWVDKINCGK